MFLCCAKKIHQTPLRYAQSKKQLKNNYEPLDLMTRRAIGENNQ